MSSDLAILSTERQSGILPGEVFGRSNLRGFSRLGVHLALLFSTGAFVYLTEGSPYLRSLALPVHGVVLIAMFAPLHECIHATAFKRRQINDAVAFVCGFLLLLPKEYFRLFHLTHHRYTQDPRRDPELATPKPSTPSQYFWHLSGWPYWRAQGLMLFHHSRGCVAAPFVSASRRGAIVKEARLHVALYCVAAAWSVYAGSTALLIYWIAPALLGQPFLRAFLLAEHTGCPFGPQMLRNSRTTHTNFLVNLLAWNMPYHAEHHAYAAVPFHALPRAHHALREAVTHQSAGYLSVHIGIWRRISGER